MTFQSPTLRHDVTSESTYAASSNDEVTPMIDVVDRWVAEKPDDLAVIDGDRHFTWSRFRERIERNAAAQVASGVRPGDRIAFLDKNSVACVETTLAASLTGAANAVINFRLSPAEVAYIINDAQASLVITGPEFVDTIAAIRDELTTVERVIVSGGPDDEYERWLDCGSESFVAAPFDPDAAFLQLYTSGTTGHPKGADAHAPQSVGPQSRRGHRIPLHGGLGEHGGHASVSRRRVVVGARGYVGGCPDGDRARDGAR